MSYTLRRPVTVKFYQVKDSSLTLSDICSKFKVSKEKIERENSELEAPLIKGEMLVIDLN